jgi:hypothetical protein
LDLLQQVRKRGGKGRQRKVEAKLGENSEKARRKLGESSGKLRERRGKGEGKPSESRVKVEVVLTAT